MLGKLGRSPHNALGHRDLFASPTFWRVGEVLAMLGKCGGSRGVSWGKSGRWGRGMASPLGQWVAPQSVSGGREAPKGGGSGGV